MWRRQAVVTVFLAMILGLLFIFGGLTTFEDAEQGLLPTSHALADTTNIKSTSALNSSQIISASEYVFLPIILKPDPNMQWFTTCVDCPHSFWQLSDRSLQLDTNGNPHIAYGGNQLYYAWFDGNDWHTEIVDARMDSGLSPALALDSQDRPHIGYAIAQYGIHPEPENHQIIYASRTDSGWEFETLDTRTEHFGRVSTTLDDADNPHIGYFAENNYYDDADDEYIYTKKINGQWHFETFLMEAYDASLELDASNNPHIIYCNGQLVYMRQVGATWESQTVDFCRNNYRRFNSLIMDETGLPHISYFGGVNLKYAHWDGSTWIIDIVDPDAYTAVPDWEPSTAIVVDGKNMPHISYTNNSYPRRLNYAYWTGLEWQIDEIPTGGEKVCGQSSLVLSSNDQPHIACHDTDKKGLLYARRGLQE